MLGRYKDEGQGNINLSVQCDPTNSSEEEESIIYVSYLVPNTGSER